MVADGQARQDEVESESGIYFVRTEPHGDEIVQVDHG